MQLRSNHRPPVSCGNQISFFYENGQLLCTIGLESAASGIGAYAEAIVPIVWESWGNDGVYRPGEVISLTAG